MVDVSPLLKSQSQLEIPPAEIKVLSIKNTSEFLQAKSDENMTLGCGLTTIFLVIVSTHPFVDSTIKITGNVPEVV